MLAGFQGKESGWYMPMVRGCDRYGINGLVIEHTTEVGDAFRTARISDRIRKSRLIDISNIGNVGVR
jgi:hypothetical protein